MQELKLLKLLVDSRPQLQSYRKLLKALAHKDEEIVHRRIEELDHLLRQYDEAFGDRRDDTGAAS